LYPSAITTRSLHDALPIFAHERLQADAGTQTERASLDSTLIGMESHAEITEADRKLLQSLRTRIRAERELVDRKRTTNRVATDRSEEHTSELQSPDHLVCR